MNRQSACDSIILLTGPIEAAALAGILGMRNSTIDIRHVATLDELEALGADELSRARLIAFSTTVIVPGPILDALGFGAYNFHPGPPDYPGWCPAHFAVYDRAATFGVTAHVMLDRVDAGPIVGVELFCVSAGTTVAKLEQMAFVALARLFWNLAQSLTGRKPLATHPIAWSGIRSTRRLYQDLREATASISKDDLDRRVAVFGDAATGDDLTITVHGHKFRYVAPEKEIAAGHPEILAIERFAKSA